MISRRAESELLKLSKQFKAVAIIGPRQSGKTTLVKYTFPDKPYVSLENPDIRQFAQEDPRGFLDQYSSGAILDEAQRVPHLFSYLQQLLDENKEPGRFIITGSNNFLLQENISQSLAGRIGYIILLPFSYSELMETGKWDLNELLFKGAYPPIYDQPVETNAWYNNYIRTYIERDVRQLKNISDLYNFERFIKLCAARVGQLLNMSNLAIETGVDHKTISSWLGILESSFIIYRLQPHHKNFNKRIVKMPKLYFYDTGLASALLGIQNANQLDINPYRGAIFENFVITELIKKSYNAGQPHHIYFWRDNTGHEIDAIIEKPDLLYPIEIKSGKTITSAYFYGLDFWNKISNQSGGTVIYGGSYYQKRSNGIEVIPWNKALFEDK
ncbi:MAG: ATP-binding protein [Bacteroidota bacterium]|nr:ATP-binding protein [Bacteroidota bacterium]